MSEPEPLAVTTLSIDELRVALLRQREVITQLRMVIDTRPSGTRPSWRHGTR